MAAKCVVFFIFCLINGVYMGEASQNIADILLSPWYCQRLVPAFITAAVTPCTYPCLFVSPHEHPRIIVQPETDGTPCRITSGLDRHFEVGKCRGRVCRTTSHDAKLKRKKRFICLFTLVKWLRARKKLDELKKIIEKLEQEAQTRRNTAISSVEGGAAGLNEISSSGSPGGSAFSVNNGGRLGVLEIGRGPRGSLGIESNGNLGVDIPASIMTDGLSSGMSDAALRDNRNALGGLVGRGGEGTTAISPGTPSHHGPNINVVGTGAGGLGNNGVGIGVISEISANNRNALGSSTINDNNIGTSSPIESSGVSAGVPTTYISRSAASARSGNTNTAGARVNSIVNTASGSSAVSVASSSVHVPIGANSMGYGQPNSRISAVRL